jgi:hypothetical protein
MPIKKKAKTKEEKYLLMEQYKLLSQVLTTMEGNLSKKDDFYITTLLVLTGIFSSILFNTTDHLKQNPKALFSVLSSMASIYYLFSCVWLRAWRSQKQKIISTKKSLENTGKELSLPTHLSGEAQENRVPILPTQGLASLSPIIIGISLLAFITLSAPTFF